MQFGFCDLAVVPVRTEPSDKAEMSTQLLFGDILEVIDQAGSWFRVKNIFDGYPGWVDAKQFRELEQDEFIRLSTAPVFINKQLNAEYVLHEGEMIRIPSGCSFYGLANQTMTIAGEKYQLEGTAYPFAYNGVDDLLKSALNYLSCPYLWGGKTYLGLDCSGLTQAVYKQHGISLLRDAVQQATQGELINFLSDGRPGDLVFFDNAEGQIVHVGILLDNQQILHCSGKVRIDSIDHQGIFNREANRYTHSLRLIRRVVVNSRQ